MNFLYDDTKWNSYPVAKAEKTLQMFTTNRCNIRCEGCFYETNIGDEDMSMDVYTQTVEKYKGKIDKVSFIGGEPTLHPNIKDMIKYNQSLGLKTTVYTNGIHLKKLEEIKLTSVKIKLGVTSLYGNEKPISEIKTPLLVSVLYTVKKDNMTEMLEVANYA